MNGKIFSPEIIASVGEEKNALGDESKFKYESNFHISVCDCGCWKLKKKEVTVASTSDQKPPLNKLCGVS
jgi:hypothetical protein